GVMVKPTSSHPEASPADENVDEGVRLMLAWQAGDEAAFDQLVAAYSGRVFALLTRFLGQSSRREDLVQEVFIRVLRSRDRYQPTARFSTWIYRIVFNLATNERARSAPRRHLSLDQVSDTQGGDQSLGEMIIDETSQEPSEQLEREDVVGAVRAAIADLPEQQRMALILAKYDELPYTEIAVILDSSEKAIKSMVHRARTSLRVVLEPLLRSQVG
ncbi:MAG: RNA polymerase sigma-70 factor (ECF subfamily), partial [Planctomycetota bacterium]